MVSQAWKNLERHVAAVLGGKRIPRGSNFSKSLPDVLADASLSLARAEGVILAECKYSSKHPWIDQVEEIYDGKLLSIKDKDDEFIFFDLKDMHLLADPKRVSKTIPLDKKLSKYILNYYEQAVSYLDLVNDDKARIVLEAYAGISFNTTKPLLPIVVMAKKRKEFRLAYTKKSDLFNFYIRQNDQGYRDI